jgi:hypothetical protein
LAHSVTAPPGTALYRTAPHRPWRVGRTRARGASAAHHLRAGGAAGAWRVWPGRRAARAGGRLQDHVGGPRRRHQQAVRRHRCVPPPPHPPTPPPPPPCPWPPLTAPCLVAAARRRRPGLRSGELNPSECYGLATPLAPPPPTHTRTHTPTPTRTHRRTPARTQARSRACSRAPASAPCGACWTTASSRWCAAPRCAARARPGPSRQAFYPLCLAASAPLLPQLGPARAGPATRPGGQCPWGRQARCAQEGRAPRRRCATT